MDHSGEEVLLSSSHQVEGGALHLGGPKVWGRGWGWGPAQGLPFAKGN